MVSRSAGRARRRRGGARYRRGVRTTARGQAAARPAAPPAPRVPGRAGLPPVLGIYRDRLAFYERVHRECGDVGRLAIAVPPARRDLHVVMHPDGVRHVLAGDRGRYGKDSPVYRELRASIGSGLLTAQDEDWERQKRMLQPLFTPRRVAGYAGVMAAEARTLVSSWRREAAAGRPVDLHAGGFPYTLRVVGRLLLGTALDDVVDVVARTADPVQRHLMLRGLSPVALPRRFPLPGGRAAGRHRRDLYDAVDAVIARAAAASHGPAGAGAVGDGAVGDLAVGDEPVDLLTLLLRARDPADGSALSAQEVRDQVLVFLLAGHETTAAALTYTFHLLGRHPDVQRRVRAEATAAGDDGTGLEYTTRVVQEAMRLYPPVPHVGRNARADDVVLGCHVRAGDAVVMPMWVLHRDARWWPDPLRFDPDRFDPERAGDAGPAGRHRYAYLPFGAGPRTCIGARFALLEAAVAVAAVTRELAVTATGDLPALFAGITLRPRGPVLGRLESVSA